MPVSFSSFPANWKLPLVWIEVDPSMAGFPLIKQPALVVGHFNTGSPAVENVAVPIGNQAEARNLFGAGSMLDAMVASFLKNNFAHELWALPVAEPVAGNAATGTITVATPPTEAGTMYIYIAGQRIAVRVAADDTAGEVATNIVAAINLEPLVPVIASQASTDATLVTLTCKWKGTTGNDIDIRDSFGGTLASEVLPVGLTLTYSANKLASGTGVPDFATAIANLGEEPYEFVALPFTDSTSLSDWEAEYGFSDTGRWGWMRQSYGHLFSAHRETYGNMLTWGANNNSGVLSVLGVEVNSPTPVWEWASAYTAKAARALMNDPARPLQTLSLAGCRPAPRHQRFSLTELNSVAGAGIATQSPGPDDVPQIKLESTTYQKNLYSQGDDAYELVTTLATLAALFRRQKYAITSKFPRHKLADDGTRFGAGQAIVTPKIIKAELIAQYRADEYIGLVENGNAFKANLIVERDPNNPNRVSILYPPDLVNQLRIFAVLAQFRLQYDRGQDLAIT